MSGHTLMNACSTLNERLDATSGKRERAHFASGVKKRKASKCVHPIEPPFPSTISFICSTNDAATYVITKV